MLLVPKQKERYKEAFFIGLLVSFLFFIGFIITDSGYFLFYGDYNVQQIPFYQHAHDAIRSGSIFWDWGTDLGANFIGSYSFYLLGSPFFWLTLPFPSAAVPYLMGPLLMLKFACASLTGYCYMRRFCRYRDNALIGALLYAFSGFSVYNIFFNHFHEAIVFFPLLLLAMEKMITENRRGLFALAVCLCAVSNYFFFYGMCIFAIIYFFVKLLSGSLQMSLSRFFWLLFEAVLGVLLAAFILTPSFISVMQNSRVSGYLTGWNALLYGKPQRLGNIIQCFFFPPDIPARPVFFPEADIKWSSVAGWLPLFGMTGAITWLSSKKKTWLRRIIIICIIMALIPIFNSTFYFFNFAYYARWFYMPILMLATATAKSLEDRDADWGCGWRWSFVITLAITLFIGLYPAKYSDGKFSDFGLYNKSDDIYAVRYWVTCGIALVSLIILAMLLKYRGVVFSGKKQLPDGQKLHLMNSRRTVFTRLTVITVCVITVAYSAFFIACGKSHSYNTEDFIIPDLLQGEIDLPDADSTRVDVYDGMDNTSMFFGLSGIQAFHSIVPNSVVDFYSYVGVDRGVGSRPDTSVFKIRSFLNCHWLLDSSEGKSFVTGSKTAMPGWTFSKNQNDFDIYENEYYIPYGFTYDYSVRRSTVNSKYSDQHEAMLLKAMLLSDEQYVRFKDILPEIPTVTDFSTDAYYSDCLRLQATSIGNSFETDSRGFTSEVSLDRRNLVFYSVPYDSGWTAYVDGSPVNIEKVNVGFMAVLVPEGKHTVRFEYMTPGLAAGVAVTGGAVFLFVLYILLWNRYRKGHPEVMGVTDPDGDEMRRRADEDDRLQAEYENAAAFAPSEKPSEKPSENPSENPMKKTPENRGDTPPAQNK